LGVLRGPEYARKGPRLTAGRLGPPPQGAWPARAARRNHLLAPPSWLVVWLARKARPGRRHGDLALLAFAAGLAVPWDTVRAAFTAAAVTSIRLPVEASMPP